MRRKQPTNKRTKMKLIETGKSAEYCVIKRTGFANTADLTFFASKEDADRYAEEEDGRVVDEEGLAEKYESMHCAEGRIPNQSSSGRFSETPEDADDDWQEQEWAAEYAESAASDFRDATVYEIEEDEEEPATPEKVFVKIYPDGVNVEDENDEVLKTGNIEDFADLLAWAKENFKEVEYDS